jgi:transglutaminase-like putative cysteine protease
MQDTKPSTARRALLKAAGGLALATTLPRAVLAADEQERRFDPRPGDWKSYEVVTKVELQRAAGPSTVWIPLPAIDTEWQRSLSNNWSGNAAKAHVESDPHYGARFLVAEFDGSAAPMLEVVSRVQTRDRAGNWKTRTPGKEDADDLRLLAAADATSSPLDGIVRKTSLTQIDARARARDRRKGRSASTTGSWSAPTASPRSSGCGAGDIQTMLETGNLSGKCADINALFVGLCRAAGVPARDIYGVRLVPSAFGYRELGANPASLKGAQHCRAEVYLKAHGWVAMDPADVTKVMRQETPEWIKDAGHPVVAPVRKALFGSWEGNWMGYNFAHDVRLPGSAAGKVGFLMYPQAQSRGEAYDSLAPDTFKYTITSRAI